MSQRSDTRYGNLNELELKAFKALGVTVVLNNFEVFMLWVWQIGANRWLEPHGVGILNAPFWTSEHESIIWSEWQCNRAHPENFQLHPLHMIVRRTEMPMP